MSRSPWNLRLTVCLAVLVLGGLLAALLAPSGTRGATAVAATRADFTTKAMVAQESLTAAATTGPGYEPGQVVIGFRPGPVASAARALASKLGMRPDAASLGMGPDAASPGTRPAAAPAPTVDVMRLPRGETVADAVAKLTGRPGVAYAVPDYIAQEAGSFIPDDPGRSHRRGGWEQMQWNFLPRIGVNAPEAWANLIADHRAGGRGVVVAVLDTGIAYRNWHQFHKSPDFTGTRFVDPYDFIANNRFPLDRNGHGTFVAGTVAEATNNDYGLTGLAYGASIMPVRVLDASGDGDASTIAKGVRYATDHGAQVINLSLEFGTFITAADIPELIDAIAYAHQHGVVVVAAAGNEYASQLAYPAADALTISVGATTRDRCLADYSNHGARLDLVAPGGGALDADFPTDPDCHPFSVTNLPPIYQLTLRNPQRSLSKFGYPGDYYGTSMAAPHVAATAALVIASGVIGRHPTPARVLARLEQTAQPLDGRAPNAGYGYGLINAGAATAATG